MTKAPRQAQLEPRGPSRRPVADLGDRRRLNGKLRVARLPQHERRRMHVRAFHPDVARPEEGARLALGTVARPVPHMAHPISSAPREGARCGSAPCVTLDPTAPTRPKLACRTARSPRATRGAPRARTASRSPRPAPHMAHVISSAPRGRCTVWECAMCDPALGLLASHVRHTNDYR